MLESALSILHLVQPFANMKGLAEREVEVGLVVWKLKFMVVAKEWSVLQKNLEKQTAIVVRFFHQAGFSNEEIIKQTPSIYEREPYRENDRGPVISYEAELCVTVLSG